MDSEEIKSVSAEELLSLFGEEEKETGARPKETGAKPKERAILPVDVDADIDFNVLDKNDYRKPSELLEFFIADESDPNKISQKTLETIIDDVT